MTVECYRSNRYHNVDRFEVSDIFGNVEPEEMDEEMREQLRSGKAVPMCCFSTEDGTMHCVPWEYVIYIGERKGNVV